MESVESVEKVCRKSLVPNLLGEKEVEMRLKIALAYDECDHETAR